MKNYKHILILATLMSMNTLYAMGTSPTTCTSAPTADNINNASLVNTLGAVDIDNLVGENCQGDLVESFRIVTLPDVASGVLYMADGVTAVTIGQMLTRAEADGLKFDPKDGFTGEVTFNYAAIDGSGHDSTPATFAVTVITGNGGGACAEAPITENIDSLNLLNTLGATDIDNLSGEDCHGDAVGSFKIVTLPDAAAGVLYMADGVTPVTVGQTLTKAEADGLKFDPADDFTGDATFTYAAIDEDGNVDATPATVTLPIDKGGICGICGHHHHGHHGHHNNHHGHHNNGGEINNHHCGNLFPLNCGNINHHCGNVNHHCGNVNHHCGIIKPINPWQHFFAKF